MKYVNFGLSLLAFLLAVLIGINLVISRNNADLSMRLYSAQQYLADSSRKEAALRALTLRVAQGAVKDNALRELLVKEQLKATIDVNGVSKDIP